MFEHTTINIYNNFLFYWYVETWNLFIKRKRKEIEAEKKIVC